MILRLRVGVGLRLRLRLRSEYQLQVEAFSFKTDLVHIEIYPIDEMADSVLGQLQTGCLVRCLAGLSSLLL